jgi:hypothetical protein
VHRLELPSPGSSGFSQPRLRVCFKGPPPPSWVRLKPTTQQAHAAAEFLLRLDGAGRRDDLVLEQRAVQGGARIYNESFALFLPWPNS